MKLAAEANSFSSTASGIMQEAKHSKVPSLESLLCRRFLCWLLPLPLPPCGHQHESDARFARQLAMLPAKAHLQAAQAKVAAAHVMLQGVPKAKAAVRKQALQDADAAPAADDAAPASDAAPAADVAPAAEGGDKKKILGASGEEVFGKKDGAVASFLGFQSEGEPNILGMSF